AWPPAWALGGGGGGWLGRGAEAGGDLVDAERRRDVGGEAEQLPDERARLERSLPPDAELDDEPVGTGELEGADEAAGVDGPLPRLAAFRDRNARRGREPGDGCRHRGGRRGRIERGEIDGVRDRLDLRLDARRRTGNLRRRHRLEPVGQLGGQPGGDLLGVERRGQLEVHVLVVARDAEGQGGPEGESRQRMMTLGERHRQPASAGGAQESRAQLPRADEAGRPDLAIAEADPLDGGRPGGPGRERGGEGAEPLPRVAR